MMKPKILKTESDYQAALAYVANLMNAAPGSLEEEELELFSVLIEKYEEEHYPIDLPDPIEAIKFRMDQTGLTRKDLIPLIGSQSKVSEVLNRKRPLSLAMIRSLHAGLGIPAEVLLQEPGEKVEACKYDYHDYPFVDMYNEGYFVPFNGTLPEARQYSEELLSNLFTIFQGKQPERVLCKSTEGQMDERALAAWQARALTLAEEQVLPPFNHEKVTPGFIHEVVKLSYYSQGPLMARELLKKRGIPLVLLRHLPHTYLDGASFRSPSGRCVIGITLRHDRLDNFWFTLVHELAHVHLHLANENIAFFDDTDRRTSTSCDLKEDEANELTNDLLIPRESWKRVRASLLNTFRDEPVMRFAEEAQLSPAIIAGRIRFESGDYSHFNSLVGHKKVRTVFNLGSEEV
jgi:HTH-type transcriptional regulator / antitoxin HigA